MKTYPTLQRWSSIAVRTAHIGVAAGLFGGAMFTQPHSQLANWHHLTILSGLFLVAFEWLHDRDWAHRGAGLLVYLHILLAALVHLFPSMVIPLLWCALITGCIGSHMPGRFRHWSIIQGPEKRKY